MKRATERIPFEEYPMTASGLRTLGTEYLRYVRGCYIISFERSPWTTPGLTNREAWSQKPDILGLTSKRFTIEIEIKISKADFLHDFKKQHRKAEASGMLGTRSQYVNGPNYLYYLIPNQLVKVGMQEAPPLAGILTPSSKHFDRISGLPEIDIVRKATRMHSCRLNLHDTVVMSRDMAGSLASLSRDSVKHRVTKNRLLDCLDEMETDFRKYKLSHTKRTTPVTYDEVRGSSLVKARSLRPKKRKV